MHLSAGTAGLEFQGSLSTFGMKRFQSIGDKCGGFIQIDRITASLEDSV